MVNDGNGDDTRQWVLSALDEYEGRLTRYVTRILGDEEAAHDAVQHAFLRLCDQSPTELNGRLAPWLYAVCRNKALDQLRRNGRHESLDGSQTNEIAGRELDPALAAEQQDLGLWLRELVEALPTKLREVIDLWLDGFSYTEIGEITDRTPGHVRVVVHRAMTKLRKHPRTRELLRDEASTEQQPQPST